MLSRRETEERLVLEQPVDADTPSETYEALETAKHLAEWLDWARSAQMKKMDLDEWPKQVLSAHYWLEGKDE